MKLKKELPLISIVLLPFIYLAYLWNDLPKKVPIHWNAQGEVDGYGYKSSLVLLCFMLPVLTYFLLLVIPKIDPKNKLNKMGGKFQAIKYMMVIIMSILAMFIIYSSANQTFANPNYITLILGVLFLVLGNYFKTIRANYFIGIRTPWTLENETVWKETHKLGGKMWFVGGLIIVFSSMVFEVKTNFNIFLIITGIISVIPILYSYVRFQKLKKTHS